MTIIIFIRIQRKRYWNRDLKKNEICLKLKSKNKIDLKLARFRERISGRKWNPLTVRQYVVWARRLEAWAKLHNQEPESFPGLMFDFDTYLANLPRNPPWGSTKKKGDSYAYRSRVQALSAAKLYLQLMYGARLERDVDQFVSGQQPQFKPEWYTREEAHKIFRDTANCSYPSCRAMTRLGYDCILRCAELVKVQKNDIDMNRKTLEVRAVKHSIPREVGFTEKTKALLEPVMERRKTGHLFLTYETEDRPGVKPFQPQSWSRHFRREHNAKFHKLCRHSSIIHKLQEGWRFGDVYLQARHRHPSMTAKYAEYAAVEVPEWAQETPF